jgi:hypothetical protein
MNFEDFTSNIFLIYFSIDSSFSFTQKNKIFKKNNLKKIQHTICVKSIKILSLEKKKLFFATCFMQQRIKKA